MKRILVLIPLSIAAVFAAVTAADSQIVPIRAVTQAVTSSTTPKVDRTRPYTFTTTGRIVPAPPCAPGTRANATCIAPICLAGTTDPKYCENVPRSLLCTGKVTIRFKKRGGIFTTSSRSVGLRPDCTFRSRVTFRTTNPLRRGVLKVSTRFEGNVFLLPKNARTHLVRAGTG